MRKISGLIFNHKGWTGLAVCLFLLIFLAPSIERTLAAAAGGKDRGTVNSQEKSQLVTPKIQSAQDAINVNSQGSPTVSGQVIQSENRDPQLAKALRDYDLIKLDPKAAAVQIRNTGKLRLNTSKRSFDLQLAPNDLRSADYSAQVVGPDDIPQKLPGMPVSTYKGKVEGLAHAQARLTVRDNSIEGAIITDSERYFIQPARSLSRSAGVDEFVFYNASDVTQEGGTCGVTLAQEVAAEEERARTAATANHKKHDAASAQADTSTSEITGLTPLRVVRLATEADAEYVSALGGPSQANSQILSIMNQVDGIYQVEIGVTFQIVFQNTWTDSATDPYSSNAAGTLLDQFRAHWNTNFTNVQRNLAHLWTGKDLEGSTIGIAFLGVVCTSSSFSYGLSQRFPVSGTNAITAQTVVLTTHEIGHNFSARHTNQITAEVPPDIDQGCDNTIMEAAVGNGSNFCLFSRSQIIGHANGNAGCLLDSTSAPPSFPGCVETAIGSSTTGALSADDCRAPSRGVRHFADRYSFTGNAGQQLQITMARSSGDIDPYLYLIDPAGFVVNQNDDAPGSMNAIIGGSGGLFTLPLTGKYIIEATSFGAQQTGDYTLNVLFNSCTLSAGASMQNFPAGGGTGTINITSSGSCQSYQFTVYPGAASTWLSTQTTGGGGFSESLGFNVQPNTNAAGRRAFLLVAPTPTSTSGGPESGGLRIPITQSGTTPDCVVTPIAFGQTLSGSVSTNSCQSPIRGNGFFSDRHSFTASAGQPVAIAMSSTEAPNADTFVSLVGPNGAVFLTDDDSGGLTNSRIPGGTGFFTLGLAGTYIIEAGMFGTGQTGPYTLTLTSSASTANTLQLNAGSFNVSEGSGTAQIIVTRTDTAGAATVDYATSDNAALNECNVLNGVGSSRCDYATSIGTLRFAAGEDSKTIFIPLVDDGYAEGNESFTVTLTNPTGTTLGTPASATITILDNETSTGANPIDGVDFFIRQQYIDFLGREPDPPGLAGWRNVLNNCPPSGKDANGNFCDRIEVSAGFFRSEEFQSRGYFIYRFFSAVGKIPVSEEFYPDFAKVSGFLTADQLEANKAAYVNEVMARADFQTKYSTTFNNPTAYVDALLQTVGLPNHPGRAGWISTLNSNNNSQTRGQVLRQLVESGEVFNKYFNEAFVIMQYFGYLRRTADASYLSWIQTMNQTGGDYRTMINGFMNSSEYRRRFGP